jgi:hypothetical protein
MLIRKYVFLLFFPCILFSVKSSAQCMPGIDPICAYPGFSIVQNVSSNTATDGILNVHMTYCYQLIGQSFTIQLYRNGELYSSIPGVFQSDPFIPPTPYLATTSLNISDLPAGQYYYNVTSGCEVSATLTLGITASTWYLDADNDGYYSNTTQSASSPGVGWNTSPGSGGGDCNDNNAAIHPGATEVCNGIDDDCDGLVDESGSTTFYFDGDGDTYGNPSVTTQACSAPAGYVANNTDCNDNNAAIYPGATEVCNGVDDDCDGQIDEGVLLIFYSDADGDGFGNLAVTTQACSAPTGYVNNYDDCDDTRNTVYPGAIEICDGLDNDCDGDIDENGLSTFYRDADGDGFGNPSLTTQACSAPTGYVANNTDCNDANAAVYPGATEVCNGIDDDCDGQVDEGVLSTFYRDLDGDTYGNPSITTQACSAPAGYVANNTDCNDNNAAIHPGATEVCNGIDDDCDGLIDEGVLLTFYRDFDGDTYGNPSVTTQACSAPAGYVANNTDCNDNNASVHPGATEICTNLIDDNCNGQINESCPTTFTISVADVTVLESTGQAVIPVSLNGASLVTISVKYKTINGMARHPKDYSSTSGTLTFLSGQVIQYISVPVIQDAVAESDEDFFITLNKPVNASIVDGNAIVIITENSLRTNPSILQLEIPDKIELNKSPFIQQKINKNNNKATPTLLPNPANNQVNLKLNESVATGKINIRIIDLNGRVVKQTDQVYTGKGQVLTINTEAIINGLYFILVTDNRKKQFREKLIIQH